MNWFQRIREVLVRWRIVPNDGRPPLGSYVLKHIPVLMAIFLITVVGERLGLYRGRETFALDAWLNLHTSSPPAQVFLVVIDDEDYETLFHETSPLDPDVVHQALEAIERGKPSVIAVDLDTSSDRFAGRKWPEAVWTRSAKAISETEHDDDSLSAEALEQIRRGKFLGGDGHDLPVNHEGCIETEPRSGASLFLGDHDGLIRRYRNLYYSPESHPPSGIKGYVESFPWAIARAYADWLRKNGEGESRVATRMARLEKLEAKENAEEIVMTFGARPSGFPRISLRNLLAASKESYWETKSPLKGAIVLLGGTYSASRDRYVTPVGPRYGAELIAHAVETSLANGGVREFHHWQAYIADLALGFLLLVVFWRFPGKGAFIGTLVTAGVLAIFASYVAFNSYAYWFNFVPMAAGLWLHYQWERRKENEELHHELTSLRQEVATLRGETQRQSPDNKKAAQ